jgi:glycosyltransferase involved in cell wall biosynthesis
VRELYRGPVGDQTLPAGTFVVVPAYNEEPVLGAVLDELLGTCPGADVVVVDDGSSDHTPDIAAARRVHLLRHVVNLGQGAAVRTGIDYALAAGAEVVVTFDGDGQMSAADVHTVVEPVAAGECDVALGTRFDVHRPAGMSAGRRLLLRIALLFTRVTSGLPLTDVHNGFRACNRKSLEQMSITQDRMAHASEIVHEIARLGLRWKEVPVRISYSDYSRRKGQSSLGAVDVLLDLIFAKR